MSNVDKKQKALLLAYELPENDPSEVRDKVFNELSLEELNSDDDCVKKFLDLLDSMLKKDYHTSAYECYVKFDTFRRGNTQGI